MEAALRQGREGAMLRQILTTLLLILLPYVVYGVIGIIRRRLRQREERLDAAESEIWRRAPVLLLGLIGCLLAVAVLIAVAVIQNDPDQPAYDPPINEARS